MAQVVTDFGNALETAFKADTDLRLCFPDPAGSTAYAIEYNQQRTEFLPEIASCFIRAGDYEVGEGGEYEASADGIFRFEAWCQVVDSKGANARLAQLLKGLRNVFANSGSAIFETHLTDNGSNVLDSGEARYTTAVDPLESVDPDRPIVRVDIELQCFHAIPLT